MPQPTMIKVRERIVKVLPMPWKTILFFNHESLPVDQLISLMLDINGSNREFTGKVNTEYCLHCGKLAAFRITPYDASGESSCRETHAIVLPSARITLSVHDDVQNKCGNKNFLEWGQKFIFICEDCQGLSYAEFLSREVPEMTQGLYSSGKILDQRLLEADKGCWITIHECLRGREKLGRYVCYQSDLPTHLSIVRRLGLNTA